MFLSACFLRIQNADTLAIGNECKNEIHRLFGIDGKNIS